MQTIKQMIQSHLTDHFVAGGKIVFSFYCSTGSADMMNVNKGGS